MVTALGLLGLLLISGQVTRTPCLIPPPLSQPGFGSPSARSNGTDLFGPTVLMISVDGLRGDYLDRGLTPHLLEIGKKGLRAKSMKPIFPSLTFPNHWTLMTGLYAESHGIIANNFWDPVSKKKFRSADKDAYFSPHWWLGEPVWETAMKAGLRTANLMWPGPNRTSSGVSPTYPVPWSAPDEFPLERKLNQLMQWIDLPFDERPQLILAYVDSLDRDGHIYGPFSEEVNSTLKDIDSFAKNLTTMLEERHLTDIVDIIFVSDHGMVDTTNFQYVHISEYIKDGIHDIEHLDSWPSRGIRFREGTNESDYLSLLTEAAMRNPDKFDVFTHDTMPARWHFSNNERIAPIYMVPKLGYLVVNTTDEHETPGDHGWDNDEPSMHAIFIAHGPFSTGTKALHQSRRKQSPLYDWANNGWHSTLDDTYVMDTFSNVEIYGLIMKLLDIEEFSASNNGTVCFWCKYF